MRFRKKRDLEDLPGPRLPKFGIQYTSAYCLRLAEQICIWLIASLPLDIAIAKLRPDPAADALAAQNDLLVILLLIAGAGLLREQLFASVERLRKLQKKLTSRNLLWLLLGLGALGAAEVAGRAFMHRTGAPLVLLVGFVVLAVISGIRSARELKKQGERFLQDRFAQVEQA
ncbi:MAG: hypothetical protein EBZ48_06735, partial [Proteobacteria bacterium]|nr:hypothetical protein [Pseudomonadota bacterium]